MSDPTARPAGANRLVTALLAMIALLLVTIAVGGFLLLADDDPVDTATPSASTSPPAAEPLPSQDEAEAEADSEPSPETATSEGPSTSGADAVTQELGEERRNEDGVLVQVTLARYEPTFTAVDLRAVNGFRDDVFLARSPLTGAQLTDDLGTTYSWLRPRENESLGVQPGATLTGTLVFAGELDPEATSLRLTLNDPTDTAGILPGFAYTWDIER